MRIEPGPWTATALSAAALGLALASASAALSSAYGAAPGVAAMAVAAVLPVACLWPRTGVGPGSTLLGLLVLGAGFAAPAAISPGPRLELWARVAPWIVGLGAGLAVRPGARALVRFDVRFAFPLALAWFGGAYLPPEASALAAAAGALLAARVPGSLGDLGARRPEIRPLAFLFSGALAALGVALWFLCRSAALPAPLALISFGTGLLAGAAVPAGRRAGLLGAVALGALAWRSLDAGPPLGAEITCFGMGVATMVVARAPRPGTLGAFVPLVAVLAGLPLVRALPPAWQALGARSVAAAPDDVFLRDHLTSLRTGTPLLTSWTRAGSSQVWGGDGISLVELDGSVAGSTGRARAAERLAGTLAACAANGRGQVRVAGDDFGRATVSLREQGFAAEDVAVVDAPLAERIAAADEGVRRAWLAADIRLLRVPPGLLVAARGTVDAVVELVRVGWRDGRTAWPDVAHDRAVARHVNADGAHVLLLPGLGVDPAVLTAAVRAFGDVWPNVAVYVPPQGAENLILVGAGAPTPWARMDACFGKASWLRKDGVGSAVELASLALADHHFVRSLTGGAAPGLGLGHGAEGLPVVELLRTATDAEHAFTGEVPGGVAERQATRRAALGVLLASTQGDVRGALEKARSMADQPGAGTAIDPMIAPLLERARGAAREARAEGPDSKKWADADSAIEAALLMNPASAAARCLRGDLALARRHADEALTHYLDCAQADENNAAAWEGVGRARQLLGDDDGAETALRNAARLSPDAWTTLLNLGVFLSHRDKTAEAEDFLRRAEDAASATTDPGRSRPHLALAKLYLQTSRAQLALAEAGRAEVDEPTPDSAFWTGAAQYELKAFTEAEAAYRLALQRRPGMVEAQNGLGLCLARRHDYAGAAAAFRAVLAVDSGNQMAREKLELLRPLLTPESGAPPAGAAAPR